MLKGTKVIAGRTYKILEGNGCTQCCFKEGALGCNNKYYGGDFSECENEIGEKGYFKLSNEEEGDGMTGNNVDVKDGKLKEIATELAEFVEMKDKHYDSAFDKAMEKFGMSYFVSKVYEKYSRMEFMTMTGTSNPESVEDTIKDIIGYCLLMLRRNKEEEDAD